MEKKGKKNILHMTDAMSMLFERANRVLSNEASKISSPAAVQRMKRAISNSSSMHDDLTVRKTPS